MRTTSRDVSVVTRQPLLAALLGKDYRMEFYIPFVASKPEPPTAEIASLLENDMLAKNLYDANTINSNNISAKTRFIKPENLSTMKFDLAITELRTKLYFHDGIPEDVALQRKIWKLNCPKIIWDMDMWICDELPYFAKESSLIYDAKVITPVSDYLKYLSSMPEKYLGMLGSKVDWQHIDFPADGLRNLDNPTPKFDLGYVGSQYNREDSFHRFITSVAKLRPDLNIEVIGRWYDNVKSLCTPNITFSSGRTPMYLAQWHLNQYAATLQIVPKYYQITGTHTYRLAEGLTSGPTLYVDSAIQNVNYHVPPFSLVRTPEELLAALNENSDSAARNYNINAQREYAKTLGKWSDVAEIVLHTND